MRTSIFSFIALVTVLFFTGCFSCSDSKSQRPKTKEELFEHKYAYIDKLEVIHLQCLVRTRSYGLKEMALCPNIAMGYQRISIDSLRHNVNRNYYCPRCVPDSLWDMINLKHRRRVVPRYSFFIE